MSPNFAKLLATFTLVTRFVFCIQKMERSSAVGFQQPLLFFERSVLLVAERRRLSLRD
jgi:hypothetical protein